MAQYGLKNTTASSITLGAQTIPAGGTLVFYDSVTGFSNYQDDIDLCLNTTGVLNAALANNSLDFVLDGVPSPDQSFYDFWSHYYGYKVLKATAQDDGTGLMHKASSATVFWATPPNNVNGAPKWRAIAVSDIPDLGTVYAKSTGQAFTGLVTTVASTSLSAGLNVAPGVSPASPNDGDIWTTNAGIFVQLNGATVQLNSSAAFLQLTGGSLTGKLVMAASSATRAGLNIPAGVAPTVPVAGDLWMTAAFAIKYYSGSTTYTVPYAETANAWSSKQSFASSNSGAASINVPPGSAPSSPANGDIWNVAGALTWYNGSATLTCASLNMPNSWTASQTFTYLVNASAGLTVSGAKTTFAAAASSYASLNVPSVGSAPSLTTGGDIWNQSGALKFHNGATASTLASLEGANSWTGIQTFAAGASVSNGELVLAASTTSYASMNVAASSATLASPSNGDLWNASGSLMWFNGSVSSKVGLVSVSQTWTASQTFSAGFTVSGSEATFAAAAAAYASFNVPSASASPTALSVGDHWTLNSAPMFYDGSIRTFALLEKAQTFSGIQTFSAALNAAAGITVTNAKTTLTMSTSSVSSLNVPASATVVTSPVTGDISNYQGSLKFHDGQADRDVVKTLWAQVSTVSIANSVTTTTLVGTVAPATGNTLKANYFSFVGKVLRITASGTVYDAGATTMRFQLYLGSVIVLDTTAITIPKTNSNPETWYLDAIITCRSTGSSGTVQCDGTLLVSNNTTGLSPYHLKIPSTLATVNTTISNASDLRGTWGAANANNILTMTQFIGQG